jgi:hypothetical protein
MDVCPGQAVKPEYRFSLPPSHVPSDALIDRLLKGFYKYCV